MPRIPAAVPAATMALLMSTTATLADVTAAEVWADMKAMMEGYGQSVTVGSEEQSGDTLTVSDIVIDFSMEGASSSATLGEIKLVERGDGTVEVQLAPEYRIISATTPDGGAAVETGMVMTHDGLSIVVSGDAAARTYTYSANSVDVALDSMIVEGDAIPITGRIKAESPEGAYVVTSETTGRQISSTLDASAVRIEFNGSDPATSDSFDFGMDLADITSTSDGFLPEGVDMADLPAAMAAGLAGKADMRYGASTFGFSGTADGSASEGSGSAASGEFVVEFSGDGLVYGTSSTDATFTMRSSDIPLPEISMAMAENAMRLRMPVASSDEAQDFGLLFALRGLTVSDGIWALFDPMGNLPRDPATIALDLTGTGKWLVDILDPEAAATMDEAPMEVESVTLNELEVAVAGAQLTGAGDFTFDNSDTTTFEGMPAPDGAIDLQLVGGNALLDKIVQMGFVSQDDAMGFRMMLGLFARPGNGEDTLVSRIEVKPDGQVLANGQRIR